MQLRYYYTDNLAAAWMSKHFGMKIMPISSSIPDHIEWASISNYRDICHDIEYDRYYIHSDSLHLIAPQGGDLLAMNKHIKTANNEGDVTIYQVCYHPYSDESEPLMVFDNGSFLHVPLDTRIIQRNGLAFHWPLTEEKE